MESEQEGTSPQWPSSIPKWVGIGLFIYATVVLLNYAKAFFIPVVLAFLLAMVFSPIRRFIGRRGVPTGLAATLIVLTLIAGLIALAAVMAVPVSGWVDDAATIQQKLEYRLNDVTGPFSGLFEAKEKLDEMAQSNSPEVQQVETQGTSLTTTAASAVPNALAQLIFTLVLLLFILASGDMFYEKLVHVMPTFRDKKRAAKIAHDIERKLSQYLLTITLINAGLGIAIGISMWALGMPSPLLFGVLAFIFNFVPYLGALVGTVIAALVALVSFQWLGWPLIVAALYILLSSIEGQFITPYFVGRRLQINTVVVFLTVSLWAWLWSVTGMVVAVPLLVAVKTFCEHIDGLNSLGDFLAERHSERNTDDDIADRKSA